MNKYDMSEYISAIAECCSEIPKSWNDDAVVNLEKIAGIKGKLTEFIISHKKEIMDMYDYASRSGKYKAVDVPVLLPIMEEFEQYFMDLNEFMNAMIEIKDEADLAKKHIETIMQARKADKAFFEKHFGSSIKTCHTTFPDALTKIELLPRLDVLITEIQDMYVKLSNIDRESSDRMCMLIDLYTESSTRFLERMITEVLHYVSLLMQIKDNVYKTKEVIVGDYKLI